jgi:hypothetical protein
MIRGLDLNAQDVIEEKCVELFAGKNLPSDNPDALDSTKVLVSKEKF